ncbi:PHD finger protein ALFIN-LIKE 4-like isoform X2 [Mercurialis annua]|uniref:PHD finger protein ALFIN-LIKE 4-like isoform X2 n=1 Tax=Mercurialis annua TaxID=3986 RepID=UPI00215E219A|nr:PHD finger protein ALFIN-LIKE 4-like isoform X2 [Mercurialis annua]
MEGGGRNVEEVFKDFKGRHGGIVKALTTDVEVFVRQCDPNKENQCLYGYPGEQWEVGLPAEEVPSELPEPVLGINFARDGMQRNEWLALVAVHSDAWLLSVAFYFGARFGFDKASRAELFKLINDTPTVFEIVSGKVKTQATKKSSGANRNTPKSNSKAGGKKQEPRAKYSKPLAPPRGEEYLDEGIEEDDDDEDEEHGEASCGLCERIYDTEEFWIACDICERWFHGGCVNVTPAKAANIARFKCPACNNKRVRP